MENDKTAKVILVTEVFSGMKALCVGAFALAGRTVHGGIGRIAARNASAVAGPARYGTDHQVDVHAVDLDVACQDFPDAAVDRIFAGRGRLDAVAHNARHMVLGVAEAFTTEQLADLYDVDVLGTPRVNRAAPRKPRDGARGCWCGSAAPPPAGPPSSPPPRAPPRRGAPARHGVEAVRPFLASYFAARAAMDAPAVGYAEMLPFGIGTVIAFADAGAAADADCAEVHDRLHRPLMATWASARRRSSLRTPMRPRPLKPSCAWSRWRTALGGCAPTWTPAGTAAMFSVRSPTASAPTFCTASPLDSLLTAGSSL